MGDVKTSTLNTIAEWQKFLQFLEGFSLDKEIDDEAERMRKLTSDLESKVKSEVKDKSEKENIITAPITEEVYDDTRSEPLPPSDTYEVEDIKPRTAQTSKKDKKKKTLKHSTSSSKDDESQSSGGSFKSPEKIAAMAWKDLAESKECLISGRLTMRNTESGLFKPKTKTVFAGILQGIFYYYDKEGAKKQKGAFHIAGYKAKEEVNEKAKKSKTKEYIFGIESEGKPSYYFNTATESPMNQWIEMFNKLAAQQQEKNSVSKTEDVVEDEGEMEDMYEDTDDIVRAETEKIEEVDEQDDIYDLADETTTTTQQKITPPLPARDVDDNHKSSVRMREKVAPPPATPVTDHPSEIYDDGMSTGVLPPPPKSWVADDDDEIYDEAESTVIQENAKPEKEEKKIMPKFETLFYGLWDCEPSTETELGFHHGDTIEILERRYDNNGWWVGLLNGRVGLVPKNFLTPVYRIVRTKEYQNEYQQEADADYGKDIQENRVKYAENVSSIHLTSPDSTFSYFKAHDTKTKMLAEPSFDTKKLRDELKQAAYRPQDLKGIMAYHDSVYVWFSKGKREIIDTFVEKYEITSGNSIRHMVTAVELKNDDYYQFSRGGIITKTSTCDGLNIAKVNTKVFLEEGLWNYGTLTCIAQAENCNETSYFAITACHVIDQTRNKDITHNLEHGLKYTILCEDKEHLLQIGTSCYGILGGTTDGTDIAVDIAIVPISRPIYPNQVLELFTGDIKSLLGQKVNCIGAKLGYCEGVIIDIEFSAVIGETMRESLIFIMPTGPRDRFTDKGDSGALVMTEAGKALAIISIGGFEMKDRRGNTVYASGAVLLSPGIQEIVRVYGHIPPDFKFWNSANISDNNVTESASNGFVTPCRSTTPL